MSKDMGREELLQELAYLDQAEYINKQAYVQLVKIVEQHFSPTEQVVQGITEQMVEGALASKEIADTEQSPEQVDEDIQELIDWLRNQLNQYAFLQLSHPHLVKVPTKDDEKKFLRLMQFLTQQKPVQVDYSTLYNYWRRISETKHPEKGIPLLRELLTHISTSGNNMSDKRTVTREEIQELIYICGDIAGEEMPFKEVVDWLRERGIEVVEK